MRCLGIPNTAHFANVTQIEDAVSCKSLCLLMNVIIFKEFSKFVSINFFCLFSVGEAEVPEGVRAMAARHRGESSAGKTALPKYNVTAHLLTLCVSQEEYEDSSGNVVNKKTYEDLKRQGLL